MSRYKDTDLLKAVLVMNDKTGKMKCGDMRKVLELVDDLPTANVRENVKGKWQPIEVQPYFKKHFDTNVVCSICHKKGNKRWNFCPNCGADMRNEV